jgi:hypothetical protein
MSLSSSSAAAAIPISAGCATGEHAQIGDSTSLSSYAALVEAATERFITPHKSQWLEKAQEKFGDCSAWQNIVHVFPAIQGVEVPSGASTTPTRLITTQAEYSVALQSAMAAIDAQPLKVKELKVKIVISTPYARSKTDIQKHWSSQQVPPETRSLALVVCFCGHLVSFCFKNRGAGRDAKLDSDERKRNKNSCSSVCEHKACPYAVPLQQASSLQFRPSASSCGRCASLFPHFDVSLWCTTCDLV